MSAPRNDGPAEPAGSHTLSVAANLRRLREERRLSLGKLATRSGISKATLSKLELAAANPTLDTLAALAGALSVSVAELVTPVATDSVVVVRRGEGANISDSAAAGRLVHTQRLAGMTTEIHVLVFPAGHDETSATHGEGSWEHVLVVGGQAQVGPLDDEVTLDAGDYLLFPADRPHRYRATGDGDATLAVFLLSPSVQRP